MILETLRIRVLTLTKEKHSGICTALGVVIKERSTDITFRVDTLPIIMRSFDLPAVCVLMVIVVTEEVLLGCWVWAW